MDVREKLVELLDKSHRDLSPFAGEERKTAELKPCPFCGGNARISSDTEATKDSQGRLWAFTVVCDKCCGSSGLTFKPEKAVEAWNRRVTE